MAVLHLPPTDSAGGSMRQALRDAGLDAAWRSPLVCHGRKRAESGRPARV